MGVTSVSVAVLETSRRVQATCYVVGPLHITSRFVQVTCDRDEWDHVGGAMKGADEVLSCCVCAGVWYRWYL